MEMKNSSMSTSSIEHSTHPRDQKQEQEQEQETVLYAFDKPCSSLVRTEVTEPIQVPIPTTFDDFIDTELNIEEKRRLRNDLLSLPSNNLAQVMCVLRNAQPQHIKQNGDELEIDLKELSTKTLRHLQHHVASVFAKIQRHSITTVPAAPAAFMSSPAPFMSSPAIFPPMYMEQDFIQNVNENYQQRPSKKRHKKFKPRRRRKEIFNRNQREISEVDKTEMKNICNKLGIEKGMNISTDLYGFVEHVNVYRQLLQIVTEQNVNDQNQLIENLGTNKLRDIKTKLASWGRVGRKSEMMVGLKAQLPTLMQNYTDNKDR